MFGHFSTAEVGLVPAEMWSKLKSLGQATTQSLSFRFAVSVGLSGMAGMHL